MVPKDLEGIADDGSRVPLHRLWTRRWTTRANGVSWPVQRGAAALYTPEGEAQVEASVTHFMEHARLLREACEELGWIVHGGEDAPFVWASTPEGTDSWTLFDRFLEKAGVIVTPGVGFGRLGEGWIRISAFNTRERIDEVIHRLPRLSS